VLLQEQKIVQEDEHEREPSQCCYKSRRLFRRMNTRGNHLSAVTRAEECSGGSGSTEMRQTRVSEDVPRFQALLHSSGVCNEQH
jgi:hypothetical protein